MNKLTRATIVSHQRGRDDEAAWRPLHWAAAVPLDQMGPLAALRLKAGIEVCQQPDFIWLRGHHLDDALARRLRMLPGARRFAVWDDSQLQPLGSVAPRGYLPKGPWQPLRPWLELNLPTAGWPGEAPPAIKLRLERSDQYIEATILIARWEDWFKYGVTAPAIRLERLAFALAEDGRVLICGQPLPPLPGERWAEREGIATPAGYGWQPAVDAAVVRELLQLAPGDVALLHKEGDWERVPAAVLVRATRTAIRQTAEQASDGT